MKRKGLDTDMYPKDFDKAMSKKKTKLFRNARPPAVTNDGSYCRAICTYFLQSLRLHVVKLGNKPNIKKVDSRKFLHEDIWNIL